MLKKIVVLSSYLFINLSFATDDIPTKVAQHFRKISRPTSSSNAFEHWTYNTAGFAAIHCWNALNRSTPLPKDLSEFKVTRPGNWTLPDDSKQLCKSVALKGIAPICTHSSLWAKDVNRVFTLPKEYIQVYKGAPLVVEGILGCYLNEDQVGKQAYAGPINAEWSEVPKSKNLQLVSGPKTVEAGTIIITAPHVRGLSGKEYREPRTAIVINKDGSF